MGQCSNAQICHTFIIFFSAQISQTAEGEHFDSNDAWYMVVVMTNQGHEETIPGDNATIKVRQCKAADELMDKIIDLLVNG